MYKDGFITPTYKRQGENLHLSYPPRLSSFKTQSSQFDLKIISKHPVFYNYSPPHNIDSSHLAECQWDSPVVTASFQGGFL